MGFTEQLHCKIQLLELKDDHIVSYMSYKGTELYMHRKLGHVGVY